MINKLFTAIFITLWIGVLIRTLIGLWYIVSDVTFYIIHRFRKSKKS